MSNDFGVHADAYDGVDIEGATEDALDAVAVDVQNNWMDNMDEAGYRNTSEAINSITIETPEQFVRLIGSDKIQVLIGELGRPPGAGQPPPDKLGDWVHEQSGLPDRGGVVNWDFGDGPVEVTFDQAVFLIGRAIDENGLEAHHFGRRAARDARDLDAEVARQIDQQLDEQSSE